jgi:hypothetical protein
MTDQMENAAQTNSLKSKQALQKCISFLKDIGITVTYRKVPSGSLLPGISIEEGCIFIDEDSLMFPGDILHEAGHIAVVPAAERITLNEEVIGKRQDREAEEMMAIAWSYAACLYLQLDPYFVFHDEGYKGGGSYIADNFKEKKYFGLPMLQWIGLAADEKNAATLKVHPFPKMIKWLRD